MSVERSRNLEAPPRRRLHVSAGMPARVALTGARSHLGQSLIGLLEEDERVESIACLDVAGSVTAGAKTRLLPVDLTSESASSSLAEALQGERVDTLVHLALRSLPVPDKVSGHELESVGSMRLADACLLSGVRKIVMSSRTALYGARPDNPNYLRETQPLGARHRDPFFADKIDAEEEILRFGLPGSGRIATILRTAPVLGPSAPSVVSRYLSHRRVPTVLGFDPLWQLLHEADAVAAFMLAISVDAPGIFNIASAGVLTLSELIRLARGKPVPIPRSVAGAAVAALWAARMSSAPPAFLDHLQYLCVADISKAQHKLGFVPFYSLRQAVTEFAGARRLRDANRMSEASQ